MTPKKPFHPVKKVTPMQFRNAVNTSQPKKSCGCNKNKAK